MTSAKPVFNFCSGPAMLPIEVMQQARAELLDFQGTGISVMEMSHRSDIFISILDSAEQNLRKLMSIPDNYRVLFMQGGASLQFSAVPLNLMSAYRRAGYINTGYWSQRAMAEAQRYGAIVELASAQCSNFKTAFAAGEVDIPRQLDYVHYTPNETIDGVAFTEIPDVGDVPLVADMSSCILSASIDVSRFGLLYAGAQKNIGPAGLAVVIVREDLIRPDLPNTPRLLNYHIVSEQVSMANTPPTYAIYLANLVFQWLLRKGGVAQIEQHNIEKAALLYGALDRSKLFYNDVRAQYRSKMNVPFFLREETLTPVFLEEATRFGLLNLQGHRSSGGCRASIYNAMPKAGVMRLIEFLEIFENRYV